MGLSPRWRGNLPGEGASRFITRSIPALAGQPTCQAANGGRLKVYPRAGGATAACPTHQRPSLGLSPRWRGNLQPHHIHREIPGSIPALAGQPQLAQRTNDPR